MGVTGISLFYQYILPNGNENGMKRANLTALPLGIRGLLYQNLPPTGGG